MLVDHPAHFLTAGGTGPLPAGGPFTSHFTFPSARLRKSITAVCMYVCMLYSCLNQQQKAYYAGSAVT